MCMQISVLGPPKGYIILVPLSQHAAKAADTNEGYNILMRLSNSFKLSPLKMMGASSVFPSACDELGSLNIVVKMLPSLRMRRRL